MKISNVDVHVLVPPFADNPLGMESVPIQHTEEDGNVIKFTIPPDLLWMAEFMGIRITYMQQED